MTSQVVRAYVDPDTLSCFLDNEPCRSVANREDAVIGLQSFLPDVFLEPVPNLLRNEDNLFLFAAFRISLDQLLFLDIPWGQLQGFPHSDTPPGHEFQEHAVAWVRFLENYFVDRFLFQDLPGRVLGRPEDLPDHREFTRVVQMRLAGISDECEERAQVRVTRPLGSLLGAVADLG